MSLARFARRRLTALLLVGVSMLALVATVVAVAAIGRSQGEAAFPDRGPYRGSEPPARFVLPGFELTSYRGARVASRDLRGRVVLFTLLDSQCTEACPILASTIARAIDRLTSEERAEVRAVAVTVDPAEDSPTSVRRFLREQRAEERLDTCSGPRPSSGRSAAPSRSSPRSTLAAIASTPRRCGSTTAKACGSPRCTPAPT